jgi:uncharacterized membrane protein
MPRVRWSMLLSHHVPSDYDRTSTVGKVRVCTRCLGVAIGTAAALAGWRALSHTPSALFIIAAVPGVLDFVVHETGVSASSPLRRFLTGAASCPSVGKLGEECSAHRVADCAAGRIRHGAQAMWSTRPSPQTIRGWSLRGIARERQCCLTSGCNSQARRMSARCAHTI